MEINQTTLPILDQSPITLYTHHALPQLIPISSEYDYWRFCNFINIFYHHEYPTAYDYTDYKRYYEGIFEITTLKYNDLESIDQPIFWQRRLNSGKYVYIWLDHFYLKNSHFYEKRHDIHPVLIYGYEDERYYAKAFDTDDAVYALTIDGEELTAAIRSANKITNGMINDDEVIQLFLPRKHSATYVQNRHFNFPAFCKELSDYYYGEGHMNSWYQFFQENEFYESMRPTIYGIQVTGLVLDALRKNIAISIFDYRLIHMIVENKKLISERLTAIAVHYDLTGKMPELAAAYANLVYQYDLCRKMYIKYSIRENNRSFYPVPAEEKHLQGLISSLEKQFSAEKILLREILSAIEENCLFSIFSPTINALDKHIENGYCNYDIPLGMYTHIVFYSTQYTPGIVEISNGTFLEFAQDKRVNAIKLLEPKSDIHWIRCRAGRNAPQSFYGIRDIEFGKAAVTATSLLVDRNNPGITCENVLTYNDRTYWCPEHNDKAPAMYFRFEMKKTFQNCVISEFEESIQIAQFAIDVKTLDDHWKEFALFNKDNRQKTFAGKFSAISGNEFRLRILSPLGSISETYPLRITYFALY